MKKYNSYSDQVEANVEDLELFNEINEADEFWHEPLLELLENNISDATILEWGDLPKDYETDNESFYELRHEAIMESLESVYQVFKVTLKGEYNEEHERLNIFWNDEAESYIMPVYHFGTSWKYVGAMGW